MSKDEYIDHEVRIRVLDYQYKSVNYKLNALITIVITGFLMPMVFKYFAG